MSLLSISRIVFARIHNACYEFSRLLLCLEKVLKVRKNYTEEYYAKIGICCDPLRASQRIFDFTDQLMYGAKDHCRNAPDNHFSAITYSEIIALWFDYMLQNPNFHNGREETSKL